MATGSRALTLKLLADISDFTKGIDQSQKKTQTMGDSIKKFGKVAATALAAATVAAAAFAVKFGKDAIMAASDLNETISKTGVLFGDSAKEVEKFASKAAVSLGQSKQQALDAAATFATFGKAAGLAGSDLVDFSTDFVSLAGDLASFNNTSPEQAINAIGSALRGEAEPLRAYGVLLDDASLRQAALELGIVSTTKNALTPQQKVLAAQKLIFEQTGSAQGDFARTSDGLANSQRILQAQIANVTTQIGTALLPIATTLFGFIGTQLIPTVQTLADEFGPKLTPIIERLTTYMTDYVLPAFRAIWSFLSEYVIPTISKILTPIINALTSAFAKVIAKIQENEEKLQPLLSLFKVISNFIKDFLAPVIGKTLGGALSILGSAISVVIGLFANLVNIVNQVVNAIKKVASVGSAIGGAIGGALGFGGGRANGGPVSSGTSYLVGERGPELFTPSSSGRIIPNGAGGGATINLTVNGAIDPEGTARTIVDVLNRSFSRGTLGALNFQS